MLHINSNMMKTRKRLRHKTTIDGDPSVKSKRKMDMTSTN